MEGCVAAFGRRRRLRWVGAADGGGGLVPGEVAAALSQVRRLDLKRGIARVPVLLPERVTYQLKLSRSTQTARLV